MITKADVVKLLKTCYDPEIPINVYDLGLIYDIKVSGGKVGITMTMTSPGCPMHGMISEDVKQKLKKLKGVKGVAVELVWDPPWTPDRMSPSAKKKLGIS